MINFHDPRDTLIAVERLSAIVIVITSIEYLVERRLLCDAALSGWPVSQLSRPWIAGPWSQRTLGRVLVYPRVLIVVAARLAFATALLIGVLGNDAILAVLAGGAAVTSIMLTVRSPFGHDGADQMAVLTLVAVTLAHAVGGRAAFQLALWFIAAQSCLAYLAAGVAKLVSPVWRRGIALRGIFGTECYGSHWAGAFLARYPTLGKVGAWTVILFECSFPLTLLGFPRLTVALLLAGIGFHLGTGVVMRLHTFFWAFVATYPAVLYCATRA